MASIGSVGCTFVKGHLPAKKLRVEVWEVPGIDGYGAQTTGYGSSQFEIVAVLYSTIFGASAWADQIESLQGKLVTIIDDLGDSTANCLITNVSAMRITAARAVEGITTRGEITIQGVVI